MSEVLQEILMRLPKLTNSELDEVNKHVSALKSSGMALATDESDQDSSADVELVLSCICKVLRDSGLEYVSNDFLRKSPMYSSLKQKVPGLMEYVKQVGKSRVAKQAVLTLGVELLQQHLFNKGYVVGSRVIMSRVHMIPSIINRQFPGYAESGMLHWIIRQEEKKRDSSV